MREAYAVEAVLEMSPEADTRAPGAAITTSLCGSSEHEGPCRLAPHHTSATRDGSHVRVRVLFAVEPELEEHVRSRILAALSTGPLASAQGEATDWRLAHGEVSEVLAHEAAHAARLVRDDPTAAGPRGAG
jgi:hypothetical protein